MKYNISGTSVEVIKGGTITTFEDGSELVATTSPEKYDEQIHFARSLGYEDDVERMNEDHDLCHTLLAQALGETQCPVIHGVAAGDYVDPVTVQQREAIVFLMQKLSNVGVQKTAEGVHHG